MGLWATTSALPPHLDLYLQSEAHAALNTANIASMSILVHWFVTPGIAAVVSRKSPVKFLAWFERFLVAVLLHARLPDGNPFQGGHDRVRQPTALIRNIQYTPGQAHPFEPEMLAECIPPWRNVTGGGCFSDQRAFDHLIGTVRAMVNADGAPNHFRWESDLRVIDGFLTGKPSPSAEATRPRGKGCSSDPATRAIPEVLDSSANLIMNPLSAILRKFRATLPDGHELKRSTVNQLLLLYTWRYPLRVSALFLLSSRDEMRSFYPEHYDLVRPLILAISDKEDRYPVPDFYDRFLKQRRKSQQIHRARALQAADLVTEDRSRK